MRLNGIRDPLAQSMFPARADLYVLTNKLTWYEDGISDMHDAGSRDTGSG